MKKAKKTSSGKAVSKEFSDVLDRLSGQISERRKPEARALLGDRGLADAYVRCTWFAGCYYCQDSSGRWRAIECYA